MMTDAEKREEIDLIKSDIADYEAEIDKINGYIAELRERLEELQAEPDWDLIAKEKDLK